MPFAEMGGIQLEPHVFWNPGTRLVEVAVSRRNGPDLIIKNLPLHTAEQLKEVMIDALASATRNAFSQPTPHPT